MGPQRHVRHHDSAARRAARASTRSGHRCDACQVSRRRKESAGPVGHLLAAGSLSYLSVRGLLRIGEAPKPNNPTPYSQPMAYTTVARRQELLDALATAADDLGGAVAALGEAYEQLDEGMAYPLH